MLLLLPCLIRWVLKTPLSVAVCLALSLLVNLTVVPALTVSVPGLNLKLLIFTAPLPARSAPLADADPSPRLQPRINAAASAIVARIASATATRRSFASLTLIEPVLRTTRCRGSRGSVISRRACSRAASASGRSATAHAADVAVGGLLLLAGVNRVARAEVEA